MTSLKVILMKIAMDKNFEKNSNWVLLWSKPPYELHQAMIGSDGLFWISWMNTGKLKMGEIWIAKWV